MPIMLIISLSFEQSLFSPSEILQEEGEKDINAAQIYFDRVQYKFAGK